MSPINRDWNQLSDIEMPYKNLKDIVIGIAVQVALQVTIQLPPINIFLSFRDWGGSTNRPAPNHKFPLAVAASFSTVVFNLDILGRQTFLGKTYEAKDGDVDVGYFSRMQSCDVAFS